MEKGARQAVSPPAVACPATARFTPLKHN